MVSCAPYILQPTPLTSVTVSASQATLGANFHIIPSSTGLVYQGHRSLGFVFDTSPSAPVGTRQTSSSLSFPVSSAGSFDYQHESQTYTQAAGRSAAWSFILIRPLKQLQSSSQA